jgi:alpha-beta hydrolase superfamily lysophospholipase
VKERRAKAPITAHHLATKRRARSLDRLLRIMAIGLGALATACANPELQDRDPQRVCPRLAATEAVMEDGYRLPLRRWGDSRDTASLLLAVHGFNDYGNAFDQLGSSLAREGILVYAYDQRGFGQTEQRGRWAGTERLGRDLRQVVELLRRRHPSLPLYLLGESMGGGLALTASGRGLSAAGTILVAPAVWSRDSMNPLLQLLLWAGAHTVPGLELTGKGVDIRPSDNLTMLRELSADPLVIKRTRVDALWGVTNLMDRAKRSATGLRGPVLLLYGENDDIIPQHAFCRLLVRLPQRAPGLRIVLYRKGWHMLTRDLQGGRVIADIAAWLKDPRGPLPSGEEVTPRSQRTRILCGDTMSLTTDDSGEET